MPITTSVISGTVAHTHGLASADGGYLLDGTTGVTPFGVYPFGTSNPMVKVTKTFADINIGSTSMDIYELPSDAALVNVYADVTTVFDVSTGVTVGDVGDLDGFQEATDWTAGVGLTDATRGLYVSQFKTMRSTSGTTGIKAYNFSTTGGSGTDFDQLLTNDAKGIADSPRQELAQQFNAGHILVGEEICHASWFFKYTGSVPSGLIKCFIRQSDGTLIQESSDQLDASTVSNVTTEYSFAFPDVTLSAGDMITISAAGITGSIEIRSQGTEMTNGKMYETASTGSSYSQMVAQEMQMTVTYACVPLGTDTQGEIDFYLQVVD